MANPFNNFGMLVAVVSGIVTIIMAFHSAKEHPSLWTRLICICIFLTMLFYFFTSKEGLIDSPESNNTSLSDQPATDTIDIQRYVEVIADTLPLKTQPTEFATTINVLKQGDLALYGDLSTTDTLGLNWHYVSFEKTDGWICSNGCILH